MVYDYENLLAIGVLFDLKLKEFQIWVIWKRFEDFRWERRKWGSTWS